MQQKKHSPAFFPPAASLHYVGIDGGEGGTEQWPYQAASAAFRGWSKVQEMIKYTYSLLFISAHPLYISVYY